MVRRRAGFMCWLCKKEIFMCWFVIIYLSTACLKNLSNLWAQNWQSIVSEGCFYQSSWLALGKLYSVTLDCSITKASWLKIFQWIHCSLWEHHIVGRGREGAHINVLETYSNDVKLFYNLRNFFEGVIFICLFLLFVMQFCHALLCSFL